METGNNRDICEKCKVLLDFAAGCSRIFLYGAGKTAGAYIDFFGHAGIAIGGFITTYGENKEHCGCPVFSAEEAKTFLDDSDGVVLAFDGAVQDEISEILYPAHPRILCFDHGIIYAARTAAQLPRILQSWNDECGEAKPLNNPREWRRVLVVRLDVVGDMVMTIPFLRELKRNLPSSEITLVVRKQNYFLVKNCPYVSKILLYECPIQEGCFLEQCENMEEIEARARKFAETHFGEEAYDAVLFPKDVLLGRNMVDELLLGYLCGARTRIGKLGYPDPYTEYIRENVRNAYSLLSSHDRPMHEVRRNLSILEDCGLDVEDDSMELWLLEEDRLFAAGLLRRAEPNGRPVRIALGVVASTPARTWGAENYRGLARLLYSEYGEKISFVLMGGEDAVETGNNICSGLREERKAVVDLTGKTNLAQTAACMELCDMYVGSNTGLLHFASALHKPSVTIYAALPDLEPANGSSPCRMGAWKVPHIDLVPPAGLDGCHGACRMRFSHCINQITPEQAADAVSRLLESEAVPGGGPAEKIPMDETMVDL